mmetsp:Transcript_18328/g.46952  ORF Transcript_18328/g.46952 Transcript_18328/m.46952 type:complete len:114 (+) Transcript_18328:319-660(+)
MALPRILLSLSCPNTTLAAYTAGEKTPNLACDPMRMLETPAAARVVLDWGATAMLVRRESTKEEPPVAPPATRNAAAVAIRSANVTRMDWNDFIVVVVIPCMERRGLYRNRNR